MKLKTKCTIEGNKMQIDFTPDEVLELGIFAKTFRRSSIDEVFEAIAAHGLTCTQWNWACVPGFSSLPENVPAETTRAVARAAAGSGVRICAVSTTFNLIDPSALEAGLSRLPALAKAAIASKTSSMLDLRNVLAKIPSSKTSSGVKSICILSSSTAHLVFSFMTLKPRERGVAV